MTFRLASLLALLTAGLLTGLPAQAQAPNFGADTSVWASDGECDDPRFTGPGTSGMDMDANLMADATDCRTAFEAGTAQLDQGQGAAPVTPAAPAEPAPDAKGAQITPPAAPVEPAASQTLATPAAPAPESTPLVEPAAPQAQAPAPLPATKGEQAPAPTAPAEPLAPVQVNFGDDSGQWANDGECDDRRFAGQSMAVSLNWLSVGRDASDCRALFEAGSIRLWTSAESQAATQCAAINFGDNMSEFANDAECDDPRFEGLGVAGILNPSETGHDAADCSQLCAFGAASLRDY